MTETQTAGTIASINPDDNGLPKVSLSARIRWAREQAGKAQPEVARAVAVKPQAVSQWETGARVPSRNHMRELSTFLGVSIDWLLHGDRPPGVRVGGLLDVEGLGGVEIVPELTLASVRRGESPTPFARRLGTYYPCSKNSYWFEMPDDSCAPRYPKGSRSVWDPERTPTPGCIALALVGEASEPVMGQFSQKRTSLGLVTHIKPLDSRWPAVRSDVQRVEVIAVMVENTQQAPG